jgi:hypothetical protein
MKSLLVAFVAFIASASACAAGGETDLPAATPLLKADWQYPRQLPRRFRDHCAVDRRSGRAYCSDHCGSDYQFYYCSSHSFGCCAIGFGYCDWRHLLRCHP